MRRARKKRAWTKRAWRGRRAGAVGVVVGVLLLGGCGIQESDVVEAGSPADVGSFGVSGTLVFFRAPDGSLDPVFLKHGPEPQAWPGSGSGLADSESLPPTRGTDGPRIPTDKLIMLLLQGPTESMRAAGLSTSLPLVSRGNVRVAISPDGIIMADVPLALDGLDRTALHQLICTIAYSQASDGRGTVRLGGQDGASTLGTCDLHRGA